MVYRRTLLTIIGAVVAMLLSSCGPSKGELQAQVEGERAISLAKDKAMRLYETACAFKGSEAGDQAGALRAQIKRELESVGLSLRSFPLDVDKCVQNAYFAQAQATIHALRYPNPAEARTPEQLRAEIYRTIELSGRNLAALKATSAGIDLLVGKHHLALAGRTNKKYSVNDYRRAGLSPNVVSKQPRRATTAAARRNVRRR